MKKQLFLIVSTCILFAAFATVGGFYGIAEGEENKGAEEMTLFGGKTGNIPFPHKKHQESLNNDCAVCHDVFPREKGVIDKLKSEKKLKSKQVMNLQCVKCHKTFKKEGKATGPTSCKKCHSIKG